LKERREMKNTLLGGGVKEVFDFLKTSWTHERGDRCIAEIGNEKQEWSYVAPIRGKEVVIVKRGWEAVIEATSLGQYTTPEGFQVLVVMYEGGRNGVGQMEQVKYVVGLYDGNRCLTGKNPIVVQDTITKRRAIQKRDNMGRIRETGKWIYDLKESATNKLLGVCQGLSVKEAVQTEVKVEAPKEPEIQEQPKVIETVPEVIKEKSIIEDTPTISE